MKKKNARKPGRKKSLATLQRRVLEILQPVADADKVRVLKATAILLGMEDANGN